MKTAKEIYNNDIKSPLKKLLFLRDIFASFLSETY